jgi:hypothetical protein
MRVREYETSNELDVYGIYWADGVRYFLVIDFPDECGLCALNNSKCDIIDASIDNFVFTKASDGTDFFLHKAAFESDLVDDLIEHIPEAVAEFERRLAEYK